MALAVLFFVQASGQHAYDTPSLHWSAQVIFINIAIFYPTVGQISIADFT